MKFRLFIGTRSITVVDKQKIAILLSNIGDVYDYKYGGISQQVSKGSSLKPVSKNTQFPIKDMFRTLEAGIALSSS
jgi:hypothetical protein